MMNNNERIVFLDFRNILIRKHFQLDSADSSRSIQAIRKSTAFLPQAALLTST